MSEDYANSNALTYAVIDLVMTPSLENAVNDYCERNELSIQGFTMNCVRKMAFKNGYIMPPNFTRTRAAAPRKRKLKRPIFFPKSWEPGLDLLRHKFKFKARTLLVTAVVIELRSLGYEV